MLTLQSVENALNDVYLGVISHQLDCVNHQVRQAELRLNSKIEDKMNRAHNLLKDE